MSWYNADTTEQELEERFSLFVKSLGGEHVADLLPRAQRRPLNADYLLWDRTVVAELKCLTKDHFHNPAIGDKMVKLHKGWVQRKLKPPLLPTPPGMTMRQRFNTDGLPLTEQRKAMSVMSARLKAPLAHASRQIRETKKVLHLPNAQGLLIVANLADQMSPKTAFELLDFEISGHQNGTFASYIFFSPVADRRSGDDTVAIWMSGPCRTPPGVDPDLLHDMGRAWNDFAFGGNSRFIELPHEAVHNWSSPPGRASGDTK